MPTKPRPGPEFNMAVFDAFTIELAGVTEPTDHAAKKPRLVPAEPRGPSVFRRISFQIEIAATAWESLTATSEHRLPLPHDNHWPQRS